MTSLADVEQRLRRSDVSAAQICHRRQVVLEVGDVSRPIDVHSMRKSIMCALVGQAHERGAVDLDTALGELGIDDDPALTDEEKSATIKTCSPPGLVCICPSTTGAGSGAR